MRRLTLIEGGGAGDEPAPESLESIKRRIAIARHPRQVRVALDVARMAIDTCTNEREALILLVSTLTPESANDSRDL